jgi:hypothetical protein
MHRAFVYRSGLAFVCVAACSLHVAGDESPQEKKSADKTSASRLRAVREFVRQITLTSTEGDTRQPLEIKLDPLLRYNDVTRGILDSVVFRVGTKGRPAALITAELYGREGTTFLLNHEFVALYEPKLRATRDIFVWEPSQGNLKFQEFRDAEPPVENARLRLAQMRRLAEQFTASQTVGTSQIVLRRIPTPLDRYEPSDKPRADGALFAFAWGVNPEAVLFVESDGQKWLYGWAPLSSAPLKATLGDSVVWECPPGPHEDRTAPYTSIHRQLTVPAYFDEPAADDKPAPKSP